MVAHITDFLLKIQGKKPMLEPSLPKAILVIMILNSLKVGLSHEAIARGSRVVGTLHVQHVPLAGRQLFQAAQENELQGPRAVQL